MLEREAFAAELLRAANHAREGRGAAIAVGGEAGIGKTTLVTHVANEVRDMRVLWSGCEALFTPRPLGPVYDVAQELGLDPESNRERLFPAFLAAASAEPTLLVVEDVHWADRATLDVLKYVVRRIARVPLLLVLTYRDDELSPDHPLLSLLGETRAMQRIALPRLTQDAVRALAGEQHDARTVYEVTGGNPFYVTELLAVEGRQSCLPPGGRQSCLPGDRDRQDCLSSTVPATVRDAVLARAARLSPAARRIVELASTVPRKCERWLIDASLDDIEEATTSGILSLQGDHFVFRHELGRRAIEDSLPAVRRQSLHALVLRLLQARGGIPFARLAHHAGEANDAEAILHFAPLAAQEAIAADAHREAAAHFRRLIAHADALPDRERAELLEKLSYECYLTHQEEEALAHREAALAIWQRLGDSLRIGDNLRWASRLNWFLGRNEPAIACAGGAIRVLETLAPGAELAMAYSNRAQLYMLAQQTAEAIAWGNRAIELAAKLGNDEILAHALNNVGTAEELAGIAGGLAKLEESLRIALEHGYQEHVARAYTNIGSGAVRRVDYDRAWKYLEEGIAYCTDRDLDGWRLYMLAWRARLRFERGDWNGASEDAHVVLSAPGVSGISRIPALTVLGRIRVRRADPGAMEVLDEAMKLALATDEFQRIAPVAAARAEAAWLRGDREAMVEESRIGYHMASRIHDPWARGELALFMWRGGALQGELPENIATPYALEIMGDLHGAAAAWEAAGRTWEAEQIRARIPQRKPRAATLRNPHGLTARELEILELLSGGLRNNDIASRLFVSPKTVDHHVSAVLSKLGARTRGEAAAMYRELAK